MKPIYIRVDVRSVTIELPPSQFVDTLPSEIVEIARSLDTEMLGFALVQLAVEFHHRVHRKTQ